MESIDQQHNEIDVLIIGAGPTGLTMACELLWRGIRCRLLDKAAAHGMTSRASRDICKVEVDDLRRDSRMWYATIRP